MPLHDADRPRGGPTARSRWRRLRRAVLARRRLLAAVLAGTAVLAAVRAASEPPPATEPVVVAGADLAGGQVVDESDLEVARYPADAVPAGAGRDPAALAGRVLAAPVRPGEPVTDVRLVAPRLLEGYPGQVVAPVRVADSGAVRLLGVGDRVDLVAVYPETAEARVVAAAAPVVALPRPSRDQAGPGEGALVVVAVPHPTALRLAEAQVGSVVTVVLTG